ncbi:phosphoribosylanthranilate isomerase [Reichenbachiella sp.]|uniref:phosphoribosylanthranilate isomerase n=1 Tax=Reichenbachiella sp. TaxID=2184521 RepID=UPI003296DF54
MKIKVCGIRTKANLTFLKQETVDFVGFIFYSKSGRNFVEGNLANDDLIHCDKQKVGVFVNESISTIEKTAKAYDLDYIQLHGDESTEYCRQLKMNGYKLFKAFSVSNELPSDLRDYEPYVDYFLFDTKGSSYGGNGTQFDWSVLDDYGLGKPFILSGGIGLEDVESLKKIEHPKLFAVDVNSRFEISPGDKDEARLKEFFNEIKVNK